MANTQTITWDDVHALPIALMDELHTPTCPYFDYFPCTCGVIPIPPNRGWSHIGVHAYPNVSVIKQRVTNELLAGPKSTVLPPVFTEVNTHMNALSNIKKATSVCNFSAGTYVHEDVMVHGFIYLLRLRHLFTPQTSYKLSITAMFIANKYHSEQGCQLGMFDAFVESACVSPQLLRVWEVEFLQLIKHRLYVSPYEFYAFRKMYVDVDI